MTKDRVPPSDELSARVLFLADHTCCKCRQAGRALQIHHIDEDSSHTLESNLAVLCLLCHEDTQIRGGFGRKLRPAEVTEYRDDWNARVAQRRDRVDELAATAMAQSAQSEPVAAVDEATGPRGKRGDEIPLALLIVTLPNVLKRLYTGARSRWETGVTAGVMSASYDLVESLQFILSHLASYYPPGHFGVDPERYFSQFVADRFFWHRHHLEAAGEGTGGTIIGVEAGGFVIADLQFAVENMVAALLSLLEPGQHIDFSRWKDSWREASLAADV